MLGNVTQNTDVQKAVAVIKEYNADERVREIARRRRETKFNERDALNAEYAAGKAEGIELGTAKGIEIGTAKEQDAFIESMREEGFSEEQIARVKKRRELAKLKRGSAE